MSLISRKSLSRNREGSAIPSPESGGFEKPTVTPARKAMLAATVTAALTAALLVWVFRLWRSDMQIPFCYGSVCGGAQTDLSFFITLAKGMADHGRYFTNPSLGAPGNSDLFDFPMSEGVHYVFLRVLTLFFSFGAAVNLYYLLGFILTAWAALAVFRCLEISYPPAVVGSVIFAFAPYHLYRGEGHLFLASYYSVPLMVLVLLWLLAGHPLFKRPKENSGFHLSKEGMLSLAACVLVGSSGIYYAFLSSLLLILAGSWRIVRERTLSRIVSSGVLVTVLLSTVALNLLPSLVHLARYGRNPAVVVRSPVESEIYGLRIIQLLLPVESHRIPMLSRFTALYSAHGRALLPNESDHSSLGLLGATGFCLLLISLLTGLPRFRHRALWRDSSVLTVLALLISTVGSLGTIIAYLGLPEIRSYNRVSIFVAFLATIAVVILLDNVWQRRSRSFVQRVMAIWLLPLILTAAIADQTSSANIPPYKAARAAFNNDAEFVKQVESTLPPGAAVFQLPYMGFPENGAVYRMLDYDAFRPYLHSRNLRWSYGAVRGSSADAWNRDTASRNIEELVKTLAVSDFDGIYIDRFGYQDSAVSLVGTLRPLLSTPQISSTDGRFVFFDLRAVRNAFGQTYSTDDWNQLREELLHPIVVRWGGNFSYPEANGEVNWRWSGPKGELILENTSAHVQDLQLEMFVASQSGKALLRIEGPGITIPMAIDTTPRPLSLALVLPHGERTIRFLCNGRSLFDPAENRSLVFRIQGFHEVVRVRPRRLIQVN